MVSCATETIYESPMYWLHWRLELERSIHYVTHMGPLAIRGGIHSVATQAHVLAATFTLAAGHR